MGILFDGNMTLDPNRAFSGTLSNGLVTRADSGDKMFFVKDIGKGNNNVNTAWIYKINWNYGDTTTNSSPGSLWSDGRISIALDNGASVVLEPVNEIDSEDVKKYNVVDQSSGTSYQVNVRYIGESATDQCVHFVANGDRYYVNLSTNEVSGINLPS